MSEDELKQVLDWLQCIDDKVDRLGSGFSELAAAIDALEQVCLRVREGAATD